MYFLKNSFDKIVGYARPSIGWISKWTKYIAREIFSFIVRQILPILFAVYTNLVLKKKIVAESKTSYLNEDMEPYLSLKIQSLQEAHQLELNRRDQLRKSAQLNLGASTLAVTIAFAIVKHDSYDFMHHSISAIVAVFAVASLIMASLCALRASEIMAVNDMWLQMRIYKFDRMTPEGDEKAKLIKATLLNQGGNLIVANYAEASSISMRNAIVAIGVVLIVGLWNDPAPTPPTQTTPPAKVSSPTKAASPAKAASPP